MSSFSFFGGKRDTRSSSSNLIPNDDCDDDEEQEDNFPCEEAFGDHQSAFFSNYSRKSGGFFSSYSRRAREDLESELQNQMEEASVAGSIESDMFSYHYRAPSVSGRSTRGKREGGSVLNDDAYDQHLRATATSLFRLRNKEEVVSLGPASRLDSESERTSVHLGLGSERSLLSTPSMAQHHTNKNRVDWGDMKPQHAFPMPQKDDLISMTPSLAMLQEEEDISVTRIHLGDISSYEAPKTATTSDPIVVSTVVSDSDEDRSQTPSSQQQNSVDWLLGNRVAPPRPIESKDEQSLASSSSLTAPFVQEGWQDEPTAPQSTLLPQQDSASCSSQQEKKAELVHREATEEIQKSGALWEGKGEQWEDEHSMEDVDIGHGPESTIEVWKDECSDKSDLELGSSPRSITTYGNNTPLFNDESCIDGEGKASTGNERKSRRLPCCVSLLCALLLGVGAGVYFGRKKPAVLQSTACSKSSVAKQGRFDLIFENWDASTLWLETEGISSLVIDAYNFASGGCNGTYQRVLQNTVMEDAVAMENPIGSSALTRTSWTATVSCNECPDNEPLFSNDLDDARWLQGIQHDGGDINLLNPSLGGNYMMLRFMSTVNVFLPELLDATDVKLAAVVTFTTGVGEVHQVLNAFEQSQSPSSSPTSDWFATPFPVQPNRTIDFDPFIDTPNPTFSAAPTSLPTAAPSVSSSPSASPTIKPVCEVESFVLTDVNASKPIQELKDGDVIDWNDLNDKGITTVSLIAYTIPRKRGIKKLHFFANGVHTITETYPDFCIDGGNEFPCQRSTLLEQPIESLTLRAVCFRAGQGMGSDREVTISIVR